jgi:hypothetical protein
VYGTDKVVAIHYTNPSDNSVPYDWVGTFYGVVDGVNAEFYCTDINHNIIWSSGQTNPYTNFGNTSAIITYILINYYPFIPFGYSGSLSALEREAAAIQMAIWHFSDGVDVTTGDQPDIAARALEIIVDANLNYGNVVTNASLSIIPTGIPGEFCVKAVDQNNNPLSGVTVTLTSPTGTLSSGSAITGLDGKTPVLTVTLLPDYTAIINATANVAVSQGELLYAEVDNPNNYQKLVLATQSALPKQITFEFNGALPVELSSFTSNVNGRNVDLIWQTKTEKNSDKFVIERKTISDTWEAIASVKAAVLSNSPKNYSYADTKLQSGKYQYRLKMVDNDGSFAYSSIESAEVAIPKDFAVSQNYPNPFNPSTKIDYQVPADAKVILEVYNIAGQKVSELVNQEQLAGYYSVDFGASKLSSGVYIYRVVAIDKASGNNFSAIKKMMLLK